MSEVQIILPLSVLKGAEDMKPETIVDFLSDTMRVKDELVQTVEAYNGLVDVLNSAGKSLELILDEVDGEFERAKALRKFASELKEMKRLKK